MTINNLIDGKQVADRIINQLQKKVTELTIKQYPPHLAVILVGDNASSHIYIKHKINACAKVGIASSDYLLEKNTSEQDLIALITKLNSDPKVSSILVQLPLPAHIDASKIINCIDYKKDVDGFHPFNLGSLVAKNPHIHPCTPKGIIRLLDEYNVPLRGQNVVIVGASIIVGRSLGLEFLLRDATVTICNSKTYNLQAHTQTADILVSATGVPNLIQPEFVKKEAVVIDVGIHRNHEQQIVGDVNFKEVQKIAKLITPVPGGVGPMTIAMLLENCLENYLALH